MTELSTRESYRELDGEYAFGLLRPLTYELGIRDRRILTRSDAPQMGRWIEFKIGMAASTCDVTIRLTHLDLFDVVISKTRKVKGVRTVKVLAHRGDVFADSLTGSLTRAWYALCNEKGW